MNLQPPRPALTLASSVFALLVLGGEHDGGGDGGDGPGGDDVDDYCTVVMMVMVMW